MLMTSILSDQDLFLFNEGTHLRLYEKFGRIRRGPNRRRPAARVPRPASRSGRPMPARFP